ncbi:MAG: adenylosuccinate synthase [Candidatus Aminicenantales bacterium]
MANIVVLGTQWGDEGKGKVVDLLAPSFDIVARYQGGHNAGHTVYLNGRRLVLHLIPSGILNPDSFCVIGNGVAFSPPAFLEEVAALEALGITVKGHLIVSRQAHLILPYHSLIEKIAEERRGERKIGTTSRGIGPSYEDKVARCGIRVGDLLDLRVFKEKLTANIAEKNLLLKAMGHPTLDARDIFAQYADLVARIEPYIGDVSFFLAEKIKEGKAILFEGAQGALLDVDHGTYPYVTSSNATAGGVCTGLGIGPTAVDAVLGVTKAYTTRVGGGPFPTELVDERGRCLSERGNEFGATTGRPRRCGWFDAVAVAYACRVNGVERIALTKPDVLDVFEEILVCTSYVYRGERLRSFPTEPWILEEVTPEYRKVRGWKKSLHGLTEPGSLPGVFVDYVRLIEDLIEARVAIISTGMGRKETVLLDDELGDMVDLKKIRAKLGREGVSRET